MRKVEVVSYNPDWPAMFDKEAGNIRPVLGAELVRLHHMGSTSVPGLAAKPIIEILAEVEDIHRLDRLNELMIAAGYTPKGEYGIAGRRYFYKGTDETHYFHIHAFEQGHTEVTRYLLFRDYLRSHPGAAQQYADLKRSLAKQFPCDVEGYTDAKDPFIKDVDLKAARWSREFSPS